MNHITRALYVTAVTPSLSLRLPLIRFHSYIGHSFDSGVLVPKGNSVYKAYSTPAVTIQATGHSQPYDHGLFPILYPRR